MSVVMTCRKWNYMKLAQDNNNYKENSAYNNDIILNGFESDPKIYICSESNVFENKPFYIIK